MTRVMAMFQGTISAHYDTHPTIDSSTFKQMLDNALDAVMQAPLAWEQVTPRGRLAADAERERQNLRRLVESAAPVQETSSTAARTAMVANEEEVEPT